MVLDAAFVSVKKKGRKEAKFNLFCSQSYSVVNEVKVFNISLFPDLSMCGFLTLNVT